MPHTFFEDAPLGDELPLVCAGAVWEGEVLEATYMKRVCAICDTGIARYHFELTVPAKRQKQSDCVNAPWTLAASLPTFTTTVGFCKRAGLCCVIR
jgi:hypothetical protein